MPPAWVGRQLDPSALAELLALQQSINLDPCGENGEYHTLTLHSPDFTHPINLPSFTTRTTPPLAHIHFNS